MSKSYERKGSVMRMKKIVVYPLIVFLIFVAPIFLMTACKERKYTVIFDTCGGSEISSVTVNAGGLI